MTDHIQRSRPPMTRLLLALVPLAVMLGAFVWIASLDPKLAPEGSGDASAASLRLRHDTLLSGLAGPDLDAATRKATIDQLLASSSGALQLALAVDHPRTPLPNATGKLAIQSGSNHADVRIRDLFERFLPYEKRIKRLGSTVQAEQILKIPGNSDRAKFIPPES